MTFKIEQCPEDFKLPVVKPKPPPHPKPKRIYRKGQELYSVFVDDKSGKCELDIHIVSSMRWCKVFKVWKYYAILKDKLSWGNRAAIGKTFSKTKDYGWLKGIPAWYKISTWGEHKFIGRYTTKLQAWRDKTLLEEFVDEAAIKRATRTIKMNINKLKRK